MTLKLDLRSHASRITTRQARRRSSDAYESFAHSSCDGFGFQLLLLIEWPHIHVAFGRPRCSGDVPLSRRREGEAGLARRENTDHAGSAQDLFHDPLQRIVGSDLLPVNVRKAIVGQ